MKIIRVSVLLMAALASLTACQGESPPSGAASVNRIAHGFNSMHSMPGCIDRVVSSVNDQAEASSVDLSNLGIDDTCLASIRPHLARNRHVTSIDLSGNQITNEGLVDLLLDLDNHQLARFSLHHNRFTDQSMTALSGYLARHPTLMDVNVGNNPIGDRGSCILSEGLSNRPALDRLAVEDVGLREQGGACLLNHANMPHDLRLGHNNLSSLPALSPRSETLQHLHLVDCSLGSGASQVIARALSSWESLVTLDLSDNVMNDATITKVAAAVQSHPMIRHLNMEFSVVSSHGENTLLQLSRNRPAVVVNF